MFRHLLHQNKEPLPSKTKEEMPNFSLGMKYKEWHNLHVNKHKWRNIRWAVLIFFNLLFFFSFSLDWSLLEGSLSGSRLFGFYLMDPFNSLQVITISLITGHFPHLTMNFWIGFSTIMIFYFLLGGRAFCSWICPYHFLAEWGEKLHNYLVDKRKIKEHAYDKSLRLIFWVGFIVVAIITQRLIFETINPVGILSRFIIYGPGVAILWVVGLLLFEVVYSKRFWCRYVCPIGTTYSFMGDFSPLAIKFDLSKCAYCTDCQDVCLVPHELWFVKKGKATQEFHFTGGDCTKCGLCVDICAGEALTYTIKGFDKLV